MKEDWKTVFGFNSDEEDVQDANENDSNTDTDGRPRLRQKTIGAIPVQDSWESYLARNKSDESTQPEVAPKKVCGDKMIDGLWVSDLQTVQEHASLVDRHFDLVVSVCQDAVEFEGIEGVHIPIAETEGQMERIGGEMSYSQFARAVRVVRSAVEGESEVLVHCHQGVNRSPGVAGVVIAQLDDEIETVDEVIEYMQQSRQKVGPLQMTRAWMAAAITNPTADAEMVDAVVGEMRQSRLSKFSGNRLSADGTERYIR